MMNFAFVRSIALSGLILLSTSGCLVSENLSLTHFDGELPIEIELAPRESTLATITTDAIAGLKGVFTAVDNEIGQTQTLRYVDNKGKKLEFNVTDLNKGVVLMVEKGRDIAKITGKNFDQRNGGTITIRYLFEGGLSNDVYKSIDIEADRQGENWVLYSNNSNSRKAFTEMFLKKNEKPFLGVVGIKEIVFK